MMNKLEKMTAKNADPLVYKLVLTGGPCSGKTTGSVRLSTFFENMGWKVYRVPETATTLFSGGIRFPDLNQEEADLFQENLIKTMLSIEKTFFDLAKTSKQNCLIICDRGIMDAAAYMPKKVFERVLSENNWNTVDLRDHRYNQVIHLITAANGAEKFYSTEDNPCRTEGLELAREMDTRTMESWVGHPYIDVIDNSTDFETKMTRMIDCVCRRMGIDVGDRLALTSRKMKFLVKCLPAHEDYPTYQDYQVVHNYLVSSNPNIQCRLRKRGQGDNWVYQYTVRRKDDKQWVEVRRLITHRDYVNFLAQRDGRHYTVRKTRRCFIWNNMYFQMDIYQKPQTDKCDGLILLETFTTMAPEDVIARLPPFLQIIKNVTGDPEYSMFNLTRKAESESGTNGSGSGRSSREWVRSPFSNCLRVNGTVTGSSSDRRSPDKSTVQ